MCQALIRLQRQAHVYIPLGPHLVDALARNDLITTSAKPGQAALDFTANLKVNKNVLASRTYQDAALKNSIDALMLYAGATAYSAGFPEFVVPIVMQLKLFAKNTQVLPIPPPRPHRTTHIQRIFRRIQPAVVMVCESMGAKVRNPN